MSWTRSIFVSLLTGAAGICAGIVVGSLCVTWYRISGFEGGAGYFVLGIAFLGLIAGLTIGLVGSRIVAAKPRPGFLKALGVSVAAVGLLAAGVGAVARLLADIPPQIDGEELLLHVELRWPGSGAAAPRDISGEGRLRLGASTGTVVRKMREGPLFVEDARQDDGRWIVPGAVEIFTSRGQRIVEAAIGDARLAASVVPLPGHPGQRHREWSDWLPAAAPDGSAPSGQFTYRFRVLRRSEPVRTETVGPFTIETMSRDFYAISEPDRLASRSEFRISFKGQPIPRLAHSEGVAVLAGSRPALLVHAQASETNMCHLVTETGGALAVDLVGGCFPPIKAEPLTSDPDRFARARKTVIVPGWVDWLTFAEPGLYRVAQIIVDTRQLTSHQFEYASDPAAIPSMPPLALSPDERSFVWFALVSSTDAPVLGVTNWIASQSYILPIDRERMRFNRYDILDPAWVDHHFEWRHDPAGSRLLTERAQFVPLPHRGYVTLGQSGEYQGYSLQPAGEPLRLALLELLTTELNAQRISDDVVRIDGQDINVTTGSGPDVGVWMYKGDPELMTTLAARLDAAIATGRYDALFGVPATGER